MLAVLSLPLDQGYVLGQAFPQQAFPDIKICQAICIHPLFHQRFSQRDFLITAESQLTSVKHAVTLSGRIWQFLAWLFGAAAWTEAA